MKRLLIFHPSIAPYRIDFFNSLIQAFKTRLCLTFVEENLFNYAPLYKKLEIEPVILNSFFFSKKKNINKGILKQIKDFKPDIVMVGEYGFCTLLVLFYRFIARRHYKVVSLCDDSYNMLSDNNDLGLMHRLARKIVPRFLDDIIVVEPQVKEWYQRYFGKGIFFPIIRLEDKQRFVYDKELKKSQCIIEEHHLANKSIFLYVGRFVSVKNIRSVIEAFSHLDKSQNALVLVGDGEEMDALKELDSRLQTNVLFTGRIEGDSLYAWYNVADYFILASYLEPFGTVTNEALLAGCPCLISQRAGSRCLIEEGENGLLIDPMNKQSILEAMQRIKEIFPVQRPLDKVKRNLMIYRYDVLMKILVEKLYELTD